MMARVVVCIHVCLCLYGVSARFFAAHARRTNVLLIHVLMRHAHGDPPATYYPTYRRRCLMSYSHNTAVRHDMASSRRVARSTRRTCRRTRTVRVRSQHASRRSAAVSTRIVERRGPSRREGSAWNDDGRALDHDTTGTKRGTRATLIAANDEESMRTIGGKQRFHRDNC